MILPTIIKKKKKKTSEKIVNKITHYIHGQPVHLGLLLNILFVKKFIM